MILQASVRRGFGEAALGPCTLVAALLALACLVPGLRFLFAVESAEIEASAVALLGAAVVALIAIGLGALALTRGASRFCAILGVTGGALALFAPACACAYVETGPIAFVALLAFSLLAWEATRGAPSTTGHITEGIVARRVARVVPTTVFATWILLLVTLGVALDFKGWFWGVFTGQVAAILALGFGVRAVLHAPRWRRLAFHAAALGTLVLFLPTVFVVLFALFGDD